MKPIWRLTGVCVLLVANLAFGGAKESKAGALTGTWECLAHVVGHDDTSFTLKLEQAGETVTGTFVNSSVELPLTEVSYKNGVLEFHVEAPDGNYAATAKLVNGQLSGHWSKGEEANGEWEGKKGVKP